MDTVSIRPANTSDFDWVSSLMEEVLSSFYGGDHKAHAKRIFDTHIKGGSDAQGHFSSGQHMFISEIDGNQCGLLHLVIKKQGTVKISPLIVHKNFQGTSGIGSSLLRFAINFAKEQNARQIYCTVAKANQAALNFFIKKGFKVTGLAKQHYMKGQDELMLYLGISQDLGFKSPHVSVVPFDRNKHEDSVRRLILSSMVDNFDGVDDKWVDALFSGYERRHSNDINQKFKIIYVAEIDGEVRGVIGATPKKGNPIKLMPFLASNNAAYEALLVDISWLLADYGHKIYTHIVPKA